MCYKDTHYPQHVVSVPSKVSIQHSEQNGSLSFMLLRQPYSSIVLVHGCPSYPKHTTCASSSCVMSIRCLVIAMPLGDDPQRWLMQAQLYCHAMSLPLGVLSVCHSPHHCMHRWLRCMVPPCSVALADSDCFAIGLRLTGECQ